MTTNHGARIRERRERLGMSREDVAYRSQVSVSTLQRAEANTHQTSIYALARIAGVLDLTLQINEEGRDDA